MEEKNLEQVKELINRIADSYDPPTEEQVVKMRGLTGIDWEAEELQMLCGGYWEHHSLEETAYLMFHEEYPHVNHTDLVFWKYKPGVVMNDQEVYEKYRLGKGKLKALEALDIEAILQRIKILFSGYEQNINVGSEGKSYRFDCRKQTEYWTDTHFWIFIYGRETEGQTENQMVRYACHNMSEQQIGSILACMEEFQCSLHIKEAKNK